MLTAADYCALKEVYDQRLNREYRQWAVERVEFRNAHRLFGDTELPWQLEDLLGTGDRAARAVKYQAEKAERQMQLMKLQRGLGNITAKEAPEELLPNWAKRRWDPKDFPELFDMKRAN